MRNVKNLRLCQETCPESSVSSSLWVNHLLLTFPEKRNATLKEMWRWGSSWLTNMHSWASTAWPYPPESCFKCDCIEWTSLVSEHITQGSNTASSHIKALTLLMVHGTILECSEFSNAEVFQVMQVQLGQSHHHPVMYAPVWLAGDVPFFSLERCSWQPGQRPEEIWILLFPLVPAQGKHQCHLLGPH